MGDGQINNKNKAVRDRSTGQYLALMSYDKHFYNFTTWLTNALLSHFCPCEIKRGVLVPVHTDVQDIFWMDSPSHGDPPFRGAGLVQLRVRF